MVKLFRVVISENQERYPGLTFIDLAPSRKGSFEDATHEIMLQLRRQTYPDVQNLSDGLYLYDFGNGKLQLGQEEGSNLPLNELREKYEKQIFDEYKKMLDQGKTQTLDTSNYSLASVFDFHSKVIDGTPLSAREADLKRKSKYHHDLEDRRKELLERRRSKYEDGSYDRMLAEKNSSRNSR